MSEEFNLRAVEKRTIESALASVNGSQIDAAPMLGVSPRVLNYKMKKHGIGRPKADRPADAR